MSDRWHKVRDSRGRLLFKYNPDTNVVDIKLHGTDVHNVIPLDEVRAKYGIHTVFIPTTVLKSDKDTTVHNPNGA